MDASKEHKRGNLAPVRVALLTVSDTRTAENDESGRILREKLSSSGHVVVDQRILRDEPAEVRALVETWLDRDDVDAVITTGGTGISPRDTTYEALSGLLLKRLDGFGELFRMLSYAEIGPSAMMSRAFAGVAEGGLLVALPGSAHAVTLALDKLLLPELGHMAKVSRSSAK